MITTNKVAIYIRVSTTSQAEEGYSIDEQREKLKTYCGIKDWTVYNIYTDCGFSGSNTSRPALEKLIKDAKMKNFDTVLVYKLDRLSRSQKDTLYPIEEVFNKNDIAFLSLLENFDTSSPFGKAMIGILSVFAQLEREQIKERMQLGKLGRAKAGKSMMWAKTSYGYYYHTNTGEMTINETEAIIVRTIYSEYLSGKSITKLRDYLNDNNMVTKRIPWSYRAIRQILSNPVYCGYNQYKGEVFPGTHEHIISEEDFNKTQQEIKIRQIAAYELNNNPRPFQSKYMLSGLVQCGYCKAPLTITLGSKRKDGSRNIRYQCKNRFPRTTKGVTIYNDNKKCNSGFYEKSDIEIYVLQEVSKLQNDTGYIDDLFGIPEQSIDRNSIQKQIDAITNKIDRLNNLYIDDHISLEDLRKKSAEFASTKKNLSEQLQNDPDLKRKETKNNMMEFLGKGDILTMDYEKQKALVRGLINKVKVKSDSVSILWKI